VVTTDYWLSIRPLLSSDLRARKISGRHQISQAGRHLIDGVPFGRPFFKRAADRPAVEIPPRKRRRLTGDDDRKPDGVGAGRQLMCQPGFADIDLGDDGEDRDENFNMDSSDSDGSIQGDGSSHTTRAGYGHRRKLRCGKPATKRDYRKPELILSNGQSLPLVDRDGKPFPRQYSNALLDYFAEDRLKTTQAPTAKGIGDVQECDYDPELGRTEKKVTRERPGIHRSSFQSGGRSPPQGGKSVRFQGTPGHFLAVGCVDLDEESVDEEFQPDDSSGGTESDTQDEDKVSCESSKSDSETDSETSGRSSSSSSNESTESEPEEVPSHPLTRGPAKRPHVSVCIPSV
jgi:hypothetical protein